MAYSLQYLLYYFLYAACNDFFVEALSFNIEKAKFL